MSPDIPTEIHEQIEVPNTKTEETLRTMAPDFYDHLSRLGQWDVEREFNQIRNIPLQEKTEEDESRLLLIQNARQGFMSLPDEGFALTVGDKCKQGDELSEITTWGELKEAIATSTKEALEKKGKARILVTGPAISGKATMRGLISKFLKQDMLDKSVFSIDYDYVLPKLPETSDISVIENLHAFDQHNKTGEDDSLKDFDLAVYVAPSAEMVEVYAKGREDIWAMAKMEESKLRAMAGDPGDLENFLDGQEEPFKSEIVKILKSLGVEEYTGKHINIKDPKLLKRIQARVENVLRCYGEDCETIQHMRGKLGKRVLVVGMGDVDKNIVKEAYGEDPRLEI